MQTYNLEDLERWEERIKELVKSSGLNCFGQDFELCDANDMLGYMAYSGMPSHYPHWSYGKAYEKLKTLYDYGVSGLPYEMVINSNPSLAYLMRGNSLLLQILTMAHVYGHNDFFKNNETFKHSNPELTIETFKVHADRVRGYEEHPFIGSEKVEKFLDAAHALALQCRRNLSVKKLSGEEEKKWIEGKFERKRDPFANIHKREKADEETVKHALQKVPLEPDEDILLFIRDHNKRLEEWQKDLLTMVHEQAQYYIPQIETKIMNEGWASLWHKKIIEALGLPQGLMVEFFVKHNQVVVPHPGYLNPYHLGISVWADIEHRYDEAKSGNICEEHQEEYKRHGEPGDALFGKISGIEKIFRVREIDRDVSFLRQYLNHKLMRDLNLFQFKKKDDGNFVIEQISDDDGWREIKNTLLKNVGTNTIPVIKVDDGAYGDGGPNLLLKHYHDGRDLYLEYAQKTIQYVKSLWGGNVVLEAVVDGRNCHFWVSENGELKKDCTKSQ